MNLFPVKENATNADFVQLLWGENLWMRIYRALLLAKHNHALSSANNNSFSKKNHFNLLEEVGCESRLEIAALGRTPWYLH